MNESSQVGRQHSSAQDHTTAGKNVDRVALPQFPPNTTHGGPHILRRRSLEGNFFSRTKRLTARPPPLDKLLEYTEEVDLSLRRESSLRTKFDYAKFQWQQHSTTYRATRSSYESAVDPFRTRTAPTTADKAIDELRERLIRQRSFFESSAADLRNLRQQLADEQKHRESCELKLTQFVLHYASHLGVDTQSKGDRQSIPTTLEAETNRHRYNQKISQVRELEEKLALIEGEYWDDVAERELRGDPAAREFEENFKRERDAIKQELSVAREDAKRLESYMPVESTGFNFNRDDILDSRDLKVVDFGSASRAKHQQSLQTALARIPSAAFENAEVIRGDSETSDDIDPKDSGANKFVEDWMAGVSDDKPGDDGQPGEEDPRSMTGNVE